MTLIDKGESQTNLILELVIPLLDKIHQKLTQMSYSTSLHTHKLLIFIGKLIKLSCNLYIQEFSHANTDFGTCNITPRQNSSKDKPNQQLTPFVLFTQSQKFL